MAEWIKRIILKTHSRRTQLLALLSKMVPKSIHRMKMTGNRKSQTKKKVKKKSSLKIRIRAKIRKILLKRSQESTLSAKVKSVYKLANLVRSPVQNPMTQSSHLTKKKSKTWNRRKANLRLMTCCQMRTWMNTSTTGSKTGGVPLSRVERVLSSSHRGL